MCLTDLPDTIELAFDKVALPDDERHEPSPGLVLPRAVEIVEPVRLDPARVELGPEPAAPRRNLWRGPIGSLILHLLPLLLLLGWFRTPIEIPQPIPVKLVIEQPPPPPPAPPPPQPAQPKPPAKPPPSGTRASEDMGEVGPNKNEKGADTAPPTAGAPQPPAPDTQPAAAAQTPPDNPPPQNQAASELPAPTATPQVAALTPPRPKPAPPKKQVVLPAPKPDGWLLPLSPNTKSPHEARMSAKFAGPNASRDEYLAYALSLTEAHIDLLPLSLLGARHGEASVNIRLREDGTIMSVTVLKTSGYTDIDERVREMVLAVGHFPPLPQWVLGQYADFTFRMSFPNAIQR